MSTEDQLTAEERELVAAFEARKAVKAATIVLPDETEVEPMRHAEVVMREIFEGIRRPPAPAEERSCTVCGASTTDPDDEPLCSRPECEARLAASRWFAKPKVAMLHHSRTPDKYRESFDVQRIRGTGRRWPRCEYGSCSSEFWAGDPTIVSIVGPNQYGKSRLAAELAYRLLRAYGVELAWPCFVKRGGTAPDDAAIPRKRPLLWLRHQELYDEDRYLQLGVPRPLQNQARVATLLVVDDFGWSEKAIDILADLCEYRLARGRVTIWTSHLHFKRQDDGPSIQGLAHMIYARMRTGAVYSLGDKR